MAHLGDAAGVVGHRAVGVDGQLDARGREHAQGGDGHAVEAREVGCARTTPPAITKITGRAVDCMPTARPGDDVRRGPVFDCSAMLSDGRLAVHRACSTR